MRSACARPACGGAVLRRRRRLICTAAHAREPARSAQPARDEPSSVAPRLSRRAIGGASAAACAAAAWPQAAPARPVPDEHLAQRRVLPACTRARHAALTWHDRRVYDEGRLSAVRVLLVDTAGGDAVEETLGAGVVWDQRGHVVVNYHCVARALGLDAVAASAGSPAASAATAPAAPSAAAAPAPASAAAPAGVRSLRCVVLDPSDGSSKDCAAQLVGASRLHDLAVLLLPDAAQELLTPVPLGSLATLRVGQSAFAVAPASLSYGVVSGLRRPLPSPAGGLVPGGAVQTDANIDAANSGGALLDSSGRLMGICTALVGPPSAPRAGLARASSLGFAVPVDTVRAVVPQLIAYGRVVDPV